MQLELSQLHLRYSKLRVPDPGRASRLLESILAHGQQVPVVVVVDEDDPSRERYVLLDGYGRVAALGQLCRDTVDAQAWQMPEGRALALAHRLDSTRQRSALEEGWLLATLQREHGMNLGQLAVQLGRSRSWVSRRLGLVKSLPTSAQDAVRTGRISAQAAQRYLLPLARANTPQCETLVAQLGDERVSVRQMRTLYVGWRGADTDTRARIVANPTLYLAAHAVSADDAATRDELVRDLDILASVARRARRRVIDGELADEPGGVGDVADADAAADVAAIHVVRHSYTARRRRVLRRWRVASQEVRELGLSLEASEATDAELGDADGDPAAA